MKALSDEEVIADLKQFIAATVHGELENAKLELRSEMQQIVDKAVNQSEQRINNKIDDLAASVGDATVTYDGVTDKQLKNHDRRITKLEQNLA